MLIDNYENRGDVAIPQYTGDLVAGFSHEYINYMLGGKYRASFRPLNDNIINGKIQGAVAIVGCNNPRVTQDEGIIYLVHELIKQRHPGRSDRLRRARLGQARPADPGDHGDTPATACARSARQSACRRCCTWEAAWTTPAS